MQKLSSPVSFRQVLIPLFCQPCLPLVAQEQGVTQQSESVNPFGLLFMKRGGALDGLGAIPLL
eukprot:12902288-Prorocentrum_lima.AAC.1